MRTSQSTASLRRESLSSTSEVTRLQTRSPAPDDHNEQTAGDVDF